MNIVLSKLEDKISSKEHGVFCGERDKDGNLFFKEIYGVFLFNLENDYSSIIILSDKETQAIKMPKETVESLNNTIKESYELKDDNEEDTHDFDLH